jgi:hypothetical protein
VTESAIIVLTTVGVAQRPSVIEAVLTLESKRKITNKQEEFSESGMHVKDNVQDRVVNSEGGV